MRKYIILLLLTSVFLSCTAGLNKKAARPTVAVSILPHKWFVERIAGDTVDVLVIVGEGQSPHSYEPSPSQLAALGRARGWLLGGVDFERFLLDKVRGLYPNLKIVNAVDGVRLRRLEVHEDEAHEEDADLHGDELVWDRHTWLGREGALVFAYHAYEFLVAEFPDRADYYKKRYDALVDEVNGVFAELKKELKLFAGEKVFVFHPSFGYFLDEFDMEQVPVEVGGKEPSAAELVDFIRFVKRERPAAIFVQKQFPDRAARVIAEAAGARVVALDPLAADWLNNIKRIGAAIAGSLKED